MKLKQFKKSADFLRLSTTSFRLTRSALIRSPPSPSCGRSRVAAAVASSPGAAAAVGSAEAESGSPAVGRITEGFRLVWIEND